MIDQELKKFVKESLKEDIKNGDHTTLACIDKNNKSTAKIISANLTPAIVPLSLETLFAVLLLFWSIQARVV